MHLKAPCLANDRERSKLCIVQVLLLLLVPAIELNPLISMRPTLAK